MPVLVSADTRVLCQGLTGAFGAVHTRGCLHYGTRLVGGVTPGKGGSRDANALPIFDTVERAARETGASATMIFVPPPFAADAVLEAAHAGLSVICCITEGVPVQDMVRARALIDEINNQRTNEAHITLIGPNCPGIITPGPRTGSGDSADDPYTDPRKGGGGCKIGIMPGYIHTHISESPLATAVGIVSRSGTLTYEAVWQASQLGLAQSTCIGIGGDPIRGLGFIDALLLFQNDPHTHGILMIGEIGGTDEIDAAAYIQSHVTKPVAAFIAGRTAPPGKRMGHAGAIIGATGDTADAKIHALHAAGVSVADSPAHMGQAIARALGLPTA